MGKRTKKKRKHQVSRSEHRRRKERQQFTVRCVPCDAELLAKIGPAIGVHWFVPPDLSQRMIDQGLTVPPPVEGPILVDTGATFTSIAEETAKLLGLHPVDTQMTGGLHGEQESNVYYVGLVIPVGRTRNLNKVSRTVGVPRLHERSKQWGGMVNSAGEALGFTGLLGRDFLRNATLTYNGITGKITISINPGLWN